jgi:hypothetical protein
VCVSTSPCNEDAPDAVANEAVDEAVDEEEEVVEEDEADE